MSKFIQLHLLTAYPPANLNRDDLGRPKTAIMGGVERLRVSSQSLKRSWRVSPLFEEALGEFKGVRTKRLGVDAYELLIDKGVDEKKARKWAKEIAGVFGACKKAKKDKPLEELYIEQLVHVSPGERKGIEALVEKLAGENKDPSPEELELLRKDIQAVDIAMFGRMLAKKPVYNMEAAVQVAHAVTTNNVVVEDDFFTAVDDLNLGEEDSGSGHLGETGFGSGVFYLYLCINRDLLEANLQGDAALTAKALRALAACAVKVAPGGKQNSFASRARASYALAEIGSAQPRTLGTAFFRPVRGENQIADSIAALEKQKKNMADVYGPWGEDEYSFNVEEGRGSLDELLDFVAGA